MGRVLQRLSRLIAVAVLAGFIVPVFFASPALACTCIGLDADPEVVGPITSFEGRLLRQKGAQLTFQVDRAVKGSPKAGDTVHVQTMLGGSTACGRSWSVFRRYRVVATGADPMHSNRCHPTETLGVVLPTGAATMSLLRTAAPVAAGVGAAVVVLAFVIRRRTVT